MAFINEIATAVPPNEIHGRFLDLIPVFVSDARQRGIFERLARRAQIERRYSVLRPTPNPDWVDVDGYFKVGSFPSTKARMDLYEQFAFRLAGQAIEQLSTPMSDVTHLIVTSCTGFYQPGLDLQIVDHFKVSPAVERTFIGFMGCFAAINGLKVANYIARAEPKARVLLLNVELCTLHLQESSDLEQLLSFLVFADGCAASIISAEPKGLELKSFYSTVFEQAREQIQWHIGDRGFAMFLSGQVPGSIRASIPPHISRILGQRAQADFTMWAIHPGGRSVLDAVQGAFALDDAAMQPSRGVLREYGNMSSPTVMFVLAQHLRANRTGLGAAMAFGPGLTVESLVFSRE